MIDCVSFVNEEKKKLKQMVKSNTQLTVIQIGDNQASNSYIKGKKKDCEEVGIICNHIHFNNSVSTEGVITAIEVYNRVDECFGILVQLPIPEHLDKTRIINAIADDKDVDGFKASSPFTPCTPLGVMMLLDHLNVDLEGKVVTVIGRSDIVGKPMVNLLIDKGATVISCNSHTKNIKDYTLYSDVVISATGNERLLNRSNVREDWVCKVRGMNKQIVIDVGINRGKDGKLCGDCDKELYKYVDLISPVPNGVGILTRLALLINVVKSSEV